MPAAEVDVMRQELLLATGRGLLNTTSGRADRADMWCLPTPLSLCYKQTATGQQRCLYVCSYIGVSHHNSLLLGTVASRKSGSERVNVQA